MKLFITLCLTLSFVMGNAQDPMLQNNDESLEDIALRITRYYNDELALTQKQFMLFQKKVEEYLIRREKIEKTLEGKEKLNALFNMQQVETREMNDILTQPQMDMYRKVKPKIQPLDKVE
ncbi:MAG: hypothetical protein GYB32_02960 [Algicola sp.]|nr:hypothetical protein [Algicola sp.]